eukprot:4062032-Prorocentrum_lima.AAC.1
MDGQLVLDIEVLDYIHAIDLEQVLVGVVHELVHRALVEAVGHELVLVPDLVVDCADAPYLVVETVH